MNIEMPVITGKTRVYGIIGHPVSHSLSPVMQNAALQAAGLDCVYLPFGVEPGRLADAVAGLRALNISGFNVTIPHKIKIMPLLDLLAPSALQVGAVNTVVNLDGVLTGHNTDGDGLIKSLVQNLDFEVNRSRVILVGAGGAARGALSALCRSGVSLVTVVNRTLNSAMALVDEFRKVFPDVQLTASGFEELTTAVMKEADLLINSTSLGMAGEKISGLSLEYLSGHAKVYDMVYNPPVSPLLETATALGLKTANGLGMLVAQGELAFRLWHGVVPETGVMREALRNCCTD